jgi:hypothetical protein
MLSEVPFRRRPLDLGNAGSGAKKVQPTPVPYPDTSVKSSASSKANLSASIAVRVSADIQGGACAAASRLICVFRSAENEPADPLRILKLALVATPMMEVCSFGLTYPVI